MVFTRNLRRRTLSGATTVLYEWADGTPQSDVLNDIVEELGTRTLISITYGNNFEGRDLYQWFTVVYE